MDEFCHICLCLFPQLFSFHAPSLCIYSPLVTSVGPRLTHLFCITWPSGCWSLNPIFSILLSSSHRSIPASSHLLDPGGRDLSLTKENRAVLCWGATTSDAPIRMGTHIYATPRALFRFTVSCPLWSAAPSELPSVCVCTSVCNARVVYIQDPAVEGLLIQLNNTFWLLNYLKWNMLLTT